MTPAHIFAAIIFACFAAMAYFAWRAPIGWEDQRGFHYGEPDDHANPDNWGV